MKFSELAHKSNNMIKATEFNTLFCYRDIHNSLSIVHFVPTCPVFAGPLFFRFFSFFLTYPTV